MSSRARRPHRLVFCLCGTLLGAACGGASTPAAPSPVPPPTDPCQVTAQPARALLPIINGSACDATNSSVVLLRFRYANSSKVSLCSGTIIAPRAVLTAAHCVQGGPIEIDIAVGGAAEMVARSYEVHPEYRPAVIPLDVALVTTDQDLGRAAIPLLVSRAGRIGETAILAGWGRDADGVVGTLRAGVATLNFVAETYLSTRFSETTAATCNGDSGGPLFLAQDGEWMLAGVASSGINTDPWCRAGVSVYSGVHASAIASFIRDRVPAANLR